MAVDECDIDYYFRMCNSTLILRCFIPEITPVLKFIWDFLESTAKLTERNVKEALLRFEDYKHLAPEIKQHVDENFREFYKHAVKIRTEGRDRNTDALGKSTKDEDATGSETQSVETFGQPFVQFASGTTTDEFSPYKVVSCATSFSDLTDKSITFGSSGTLLDGNNNALLEDKALLVARTPRFTGANIKENKTRVYESKADWQAAIINEANETRAQGRPVITILTTKKRVDAFYQACVARESSKESKQLRTFKGDEPPEAQDRLLKEATAPGNHTIIGAVCARGKDYRCDDPTINSKEKHGVKVIKAVPAPYESANIQWNFRTGRGENPGEVSAHYLVEDVLALCEEAGVTPPPKITDDNIDALLKEVWTARIRILNASRKNAKCPANKMSNDFFGDERLKGDKVCRSFALGPLHTVVCGDTKEGEKQYRKFVATHSQRG